jgi:acetyl-CoA C-acetyltransferase
VSDRQRAVIVAGARTPIGSFGGAFRETPGHVLGAAAVTAALERADLRDAVVDEVVMGCIGQVGPDGYNARRVALAAGLPESTPAFNVNRLCGSGLQAVWSGAQQLLWGDSELIVAGGDESMTRMPFLDYGARFNDRLGDRTLVDGTVAMLTDPFSGQHMGMTAENVAARYGVSREEQDAFALESQRRAATEAARAAFAEEIVAVQTEGRRGRLVDVDEHPRPDTSIEALRGLRPVFKTDGTVTAGNAAGINDAGAAVALMREETVRERGLQGIATLEAVATAAIEPGIMGYAPVLALQKLFARTGLSAADIGVVELNEAFAAQAVAVIRDAGLDPERTNPYGGAIALGHPVGATGAILSLRVALDLQRRDLEYGIVTMCIGGGQALAALFRRFNA